MEHMERFGLKTIRIGASERMRASLHHTTLAERIKLHRDYPALNEQFNALKEEQKIKDIANPEDIGKR
jgi:ABC-type phosphate transport system auxiliary subunit